MSKIGNSSRLITIIDLDCRDIDICDLVNECNRLLEDYRKRTKDITLSPLKVILRKEVEEDLIIKLLDVLLKWRLQI